MVLQHLNGAHGIYRQVAGGLVVVVAKQVFPFDIKFVDGLALVTHRAVVLHGDAREFSQHVFKMGIAPANKLPDVVGQRVARRTNGWRFHLHLAQRYRLLRHGKEIHLTNRKGGCRPAKTGIAHGGEAQPAVARSHYGEFAIGIRHGEGRCLIVRRKDTAHHLGQRLVGKAVGKGKDKRQSIAGLMGLQRTDADEGDKNGEQYPHSQSRSMGL